MCYAIHKFFTSVWPIFLFVFFCWKFYEVQFMRAYVRACVCAFVCSCEYCHNFKITHTHTQSLICTYTHIYTYINWDQPFFYCAHSLSQFFSWFSLCCCFITSVTFFFFKNITFESNNDSFFWLCLWPLLLHCTKSLHLFIYKQRATRKPFVFHFAQHSAIKLNGIFEQFWSVSTFIHSFAVNMLCAHHNFQAFCCCCCCLWVRC